MNYFEDMEIGTVARYGGYLVTREAVIDFAEKFDPQPFHLSDEDAARTMFGRMSASGWHIAAMMMRMHVDHARASGTRNAVIAGAGVDELRWIRPVYPGDVLRVEAELIEKIPSRSKPDRGIIKMRTTGFNQLDEPVITMITAAMALRRPIDRNSSPTE